MAYSGDISGKKLDVTVAGANIVSEGGASEWRFRGQAQKLDGTIGRDGGFGRTAAGVRQGDVSATILVDISSGTTIAEGDTLTDVRLWYDYDHVTPAVLAPTVVILTAERGTEVNGRVEFRITGDTCGSYT